MESQYLANNVRELELTKRVSLALTQPLALVQLLQTGSCNFTLDETLFDGDHPGHYFRRSRSVALTIPCVSGPYTGVNATLALGSSVVRNVAPTAGYKPWLWVNANTNNDPGISASPAVAAMPVIATSSGQNDAGLFDANLRDERWLPFEGQGAASSWSLNMDPRDNNFDISSVTDVVVHLRYSARFGGDAAAVRSALKPNKARSILISTRNTFGDAYYSFFNPTDTSSTQQTLVLPLSNALFPFSNLGVPSITSVTALVILAEPLSGSLATALGGGLAMPATVGMGSAAPVNVVFKAVTGTAADGTAVAGLTTGDVAVTLAAPATMTVTLPQASLPASLQKAINGQMRLNSAQISDILLIVSYNVG
jgi:Tc toxin complex TcA C-terminal TcB-binding domain